MRTTTLWVLLLALATAPTRAEPPAVPDPDDLAEQLLDGLRAEPIDCPEILSELEDAASAHCAAVDLEWRQFKKAFKKFLGRNNSWQAVEPAWEMKAGYQLRHVIVGMTPLIVMWEPEERWIATWSRHPCFKASYLEALDVRIADGETVSEPKLLSKTRPSYPEEARVRRISGAVVLHAIVGPDGRVGDTCVVKSTRSGAGFEEEAERVVREWRYAPGMMDGNPVTVLFRVRLDWTLN